MNKNALNSQNDGVNSNIRKPEDWPDGRSAPGEETTGAAPTDVTEMARKAGLNCRVMISAAVCSICEVPNGRIGNKPGLLGDMLWMLTRVIGGQIRSLKESNGPHTVYYFDFYGLRRRKGTPDLICLKAVHGPGDNGENMIVVLRPDEVEPKSR